MTQKLTLSQNINPEQLISNLNMYEISIPNWNKNDQCFYIKLNDCLIYNDMQITANISINN